MSFDEFNETLLSLSSIREFWAAAWAELAWVKLQFNPQKLERQLQIVLLRHVPLFRQSLSVEHEEFELEFEE